MYRDTILFYFFFTLKLRVEGSPEYLFGLGLSNNVYVPARVSKLQRFKKEEEKRITGDVSVFNDHIILYI